MTPEDGETLALLQVLVGADREVYRVRSNDILGRRLDCAVSLQGSTVSHTHARIVFRGGRYMLEDMRSRNGTIVNGDRIRTHALQDRDVIRIGSTVLQFRLGGLASVDPIPRPFLEPPERGHCVILTPGQLEQLEETEDSGSELIKPTRRSA